MPIVDWSLRKCKYALLQEKELEGKWGQQGKATLLSPDR